VIPDRQQGRGGKIPAFCFAGITAGPGIALGYSAPRPAAARALVVLGRDICDVILEMNSDSQAASAFIVALLQDETVPKTDRSVLSGLLLAGHSGPTRLH
jgi:hypothetical protein